jgi:hypothetical protein
MKMRHVLHLMLLLTSILGGLHRLSAQVKPPSEMITYERPGYIIEIPETWQTLYYFSQGDGLGISLLTPSTITSTEEEIDTLFTDGTVSESIKNSLTTDITLGIVETQCDLYEQCLGMESLALILPGEIKRGLGDALIDASEMQPVTMNDAEGYEIEIIFNGGELFEGTIFELSEI